MQGLFVTFEGPDGSGKTTQLRLLADKLQEAGYDVVVTREPGGTRISDKIRAILLSLEHTEMVDQAEILLYAASRAQHVHELIWPALQKNKIVLCDRYIDASIAYQGFGLGIEPGIIKNISEFASSHLHPQKTYLIDVPVMISQQRIRHRAINKGEPILDRIEQKETDYHERVRQAFLDLASHEPDRIHLIDGNCKQEKIATEIWTDFQFFLDNRLSSM